MTENESTHSAERVLLPFRKLAQKRGFQKIKTTYDFVQINENSTTSRKFLAKQALRMVE